MGGRQKLRKLQRWQKLQRLQRLQKRQRLLQLVMRIQKSYHRLVVWQKADELVRAVYVVTINFPKEELFGIVSQLRRAIVSVAANIVEGQAKNTPKDFARFLYISRGSLAECEYYLELSLNLGFIDQGTYEKLERLREEVGFLLFKLINSIK